MNSVFAGFERHSKARRYILNAGLGRGFYAIENQRLVPASRILEFL